MKGTNMDEKKTQRINELSRKAKTTGLTDAEKAEQAQLRKEYVAAFRTSLTNILDNTYIQNPDGTKVKVHRRKK